METKKLNKKRINSLNPYVRELLIGRPIDEPMIPLDIYIALGDNIIKFLALITSNQYLSEKSRESNSTFYGYLTDYLLADQKGLELGISRSILYELDQVDTKQNLFKDSAALKKNVEQWLIVKNSIYKVDFGDLSKKYRNIITPIIESLFNTAFGLIEEQFFTGETFIFNNRPISIFPFFVFQNCSHPDCLGDSKKHIFAFESYSDVSAKYHYKCWGNGHDFITDPTSSELEFKDFLQIIGKKNGKSKFPKRCISYLPLFETSYPEMKNLVELLYKQTKTETKNSLWPLSTPCLKTPNISDHIKNKILLDCIEHGPVLVLRTVASLEGAEELVGYVREILKNNNVDKIDERIISLELKCESIANERYAPIGQQLDLDDSDPEMIKIRDEVYSIEVAEILGFHLHEIDNISHLEHHHDKIKKIIKIYSKKKLEKKKILGLNCRKESKKLFYELESVYKELVCFYQFILDTKINNSKPSIGINALNNLIQLHNDLLDLHDKFSNEIEINPKKEEKFENLFGKRKDPNNMKFGIFDVDKYNELVKIGDINGSLLDLKVALSSKDNENYYLKGNSLDSYIIILEWIERIYSFFSNEQKRIFPYKILFTVSSEIRPFSNSDEAIYGIKTCQYFSYVSGVNSEERENTMKIYTKQPIDFSCYYYCLPHPNRSTENIWVEPLLIPVKDIGYSEPKLILENKTNEEIEQIFDCNEPYIFISYAHADFKIIKPDLEFISQKGYRFFCNRFNTEEFKGIPLGNNWSVYLENRIANCHQFIIYISETSENREQVIWELNKARKYKKGEIIPILINKLKNPHQSIENLIDFDHANGIFKYDYSNDLNEYWKILSTKIDKKCLKFRNNGEPLS